MTKSTIEALVPAGLNGGTEYTLVPKARNEDAVETSSGAGGSFSTTVPPPEYPTVWGVSIGTDIN